MSSARGTRLAGWAFVVIGIVLALIGLGEIVPPLTASVGKTEGKVVKEEHDEGRITVIEYQVNGKTYTSKAPHAGFSRPHQVGETVAVVYKADDPAVAGIDSFFYRWFGPAAVSASGALFAGFGALLVCMAPRMMYAKTV